VNVSVCSKIIIMTGPNYSACISCVHGEWVPVTMAWRFLNLRIEEQPAVWRVAANILNKPSRTADEGWSSSLGVVRGDNNPPVKSEVKKFSQGEMLPLAKTNLEVNYPPTRKWRALVRTVMNFRVP
jgi:hypothetical protein